MALCAGITTKRVTTWVRSCSISAALFGFMGVNLSGPHTLFIFAVGEPPPFATLIPAHPWLSDLPYLWVSFGPAHIDHWSVLVDRPGPCFTGAWRDGPSLQSRSSLPPIDKRRAGQLTELINLL